MDPASTVLVTGAAHRIGAAIARRFADEGRRVLVHYNTSEVAARALASELPSADAAWMDLANAPQCEAEVRRLAAAHPGWDMLVLSASLFEPDWGPDFSSDNLAESIKVNLAGNLALLRAFLAATDAAKPRTVVVLLDQKLANLNPDFFSYTLSKGALEYALRMLAMQLSDTSDRIYGIAPGLSQPSHDQTAEEFAATARRNLLGRANTPEEVADAVWFASRRLLETGSILYADSGQHLVRQERDVMYAVREEA